MSAVEQEMIKQDLYRRQMGRLGSRKRDLRGDQPATGETLATLPDAGREEMQRAIDAAAGIQSEWQETTAQERAQIMQRAARLMHERKEHLVRVMTLEQGKPLAESRGEIVYAASFVEWFAEEGRRVYDDIVPSSSSDKRIMVIKRPVGVTAAITPWNFPAAMITRKCAPALAAGCTMVIKPSELTPPFRPGDGEDFRGGWATRRRSLHRMRAGCRGNNLSGHGGPARPQGSRSTSTPSTFRWEASPV